MRAVNFDSGSIASATRGTVLRDGPSGPVTTDSRAAGAGSWFVALRGPRFDGHDFVPAAWATGAGAVVDHVPEPLGGPCVLVKDTLVALQDLGRAARRAFAGPVVGITGSAGKTTTRALCAAALAPRFRVHQTSGNLNNHIGLPLTLVAAPPDADAWVVELGTSSPGEIALLTEIARPTVRVVVNVGPAHLEELGGLDGVAREKCAIYGGATSGDTAVVNQDDPFLRDAVLPTGVRRVAFGASPAADPRLVDARVDAALHTEAVYEGAFGRVVVKLASPGRHVALDGAAALAVALAVGVAAREAAAAMESYEPVGMRQRVETSPAGVVVINDAYNANPTSMRAALEALGGLPGRRFAVLGDMLELGPAEHDWHRDVLAFALTQGLAAVVVCGERMARAATVGVHVAENADDAAHWLGDRVRHGDTVLVKGSRGARMERVAMALLAREG